MPDFTTYVKELDNGDYEVKLGAGYVPKLVKLREVIEYEYNRGLSASTVAIPANMTVESFKDKMTCMGLVAEYRATGRIAGVNAGQ